MDSRSVCTTIIKSLANAVALNSKESYWVQSSGSHDLKTFSNELIVTIGEINTTVEYNDRAATNVNVTVVKDGYRPIIGRDLYPQLGLSLTQSKQVLNINQNQRLF